MATKKKVSDTAIITKNKFATAAEFSKYIEGVATSKKQGYMEAVIEFCQSNDIDIEVVSKLITKSLKDKIRSEAENLNLMKRKDSPELPL